MNTSLYRLIAAASAGAVLLLAAPAASARDRVDWSVNIGVPFNGYASYGQPAYVAPQPVYYRPQPVYVQPAPVYYPSQPAYAVPAQPYGVVQYNNYSSQGHWNNGRHDRGHGHRHDYRDHGGYRR